MFDISAASENLLPHHHHHHNPRLLQELISVLRYDFLYSSSSTSSNLSSLSYSPQPLNIFLLHLLFFFNPFSSSTSSSPIPRFSSTRHKSHSHLRYHFLVLYPATQISPKRRSHLQILGARTVTQSPTLLEWPLNLAWSFFLDERKMKHFCTEGKKQRQWSWTEKELPYDQAPGNWASLFLLLLVLWCPSVHRLSLFPSVSHYRTHASSTHNNAIQHTDLEVWTIKSLHSR